MTVARRAVLGLLFAMSALGGCADDAVPTAAEAAVSILAHGCSAAPTRGAGLVVDRGRVLTAAHVVAGASSIEVHRGDETYAAPVVAFDPRNDVAVLAVPFAAGVFPIGSLDSGSVSEGAVTVQRSDGPDVLPVRVLRPVTIRTEDVFGEVLVERPGYELEASIEAGDSGGVVIVDGVAVAVVWARSRQTDGRAWAIDAAATWPALAAQIAAGPLPLDLRASECP